MELRYNRSMITRSHKISELLKPGKALIIYSIKTCWENNAPCRFLVFDKA